MHLIFFTQKNLIYWHSPINPQIRVIPSNSSLTLWSIKVITLILKYDFLTQHTETMRKASGDKKLTMIFFCKLHGNMLSKSWGTFSYIYSNIKN